MVEAPLPLPWLQPAVRLVREAVLGASDGALAMKDGVSGGIAAAREMASAASARLHPEEREAARAVLVGTVPILSIGVASRVPVLRRWIVWAPLTSVAVRRPPAPPPGRPEG